jgi:ABC-2 type transport system permease protein
MAAVAVAVPGLRSGAIRAFLAICWRDIFVVWRQLPAFLAQVLLQPLFLLFIFGRVLPDLGFARGAYATTLLPGVIALTIVFTAMQSTALPLVLEFSFTREIEDRLLAPLPVAMVAVQKIVIASLRALVAGAVIFPLGALILGSNFHLSSAHVPLVIVYCVLAALLGSGIGLSMGTFVEPNQINIMFAVIFTPLFFTGCTQYPWALLSRLEWFQIVTLFNPITYASEGLRATLVPQMAHMQILISLLALCGFIIVFCSLGVYGFVRRAID